MKTAPQQVLVEEEKQALAKGKFVRVIGECPRRKITDLWR